MTIKKIINVLLKWLYKLIQIVKILLFSPVLLFKMSAIIHFESEKNYQNT